MQESEAKRLADEALMGILNRKRNRAAKIIKHAIRESRQGSSMHACPHTPSHPDSSSTTTTPSRQLAG